MVTFMNKLKVGWVGFLQEDAQYWENLLILAKLGYKGLEGGDNFLKADKDIERLRGIGLRVLTIGADLEELKKERYQEVVDKVKKLGADRATVWACSVNASFWGEEPQYDEVMRDIEVMEKAASILNVEGIQLCYHNHFQDFTVSFNHVRFIDLLLLHTKELKLELDTGWVQNGLENPCTFMRRTGSRIDAIHVKDYCSGEKRKGYMGYNPIFTTVGNGELDVPSILDTAQDLGIEWAIVEQDELHNLNAVESLAASYLNMKETGYIE